MKILDQPFNIVNQLAFFSAENYKQNKTNRRKKWFFPRWTGHTLQFKIHSMAFQPSISYAKKKKTNAGMSQKADESLRA